MKKILSTSEIVQDLDLEVEPKELCAAAEADYDERKSTLVMKLDAFIRQVCETAVCGGWCGNLLSDNASPAEGRLRR